MMPLAAVKGAGNALAMPWQGLSRAIRGSGITNLGFFLLSSMIQQPLKRRLDSTCDGT